LKGGRTEESSPHSKKSSRLAKQKNSAFPEIIESALPEKLPGFSFMPDTA
jgi:hypothetical protein